jgi:protein-disulfide isomerase
LAASPWLSPSPRWRSASPPAGKKEGGGSAPSDQPAAKVAPPAGKAWQDVVVKTPEGGYLMGNANAPIKVVEYGSLSCPHCAEAQQRRFPFAGRQLRQLGPRQL